MHKTRLLWLFGFLLLSASCSGDAGNSTGSSPATTGEHDGGGEGPPAEDGGGEVGATSGSESRPDGGTTGHGDAGPNVGPACSPVCAHGACMVGTCQCPAAYAGPACAQCAVGFVLGQDGSTCEAAACAGQADSCTLGAVRCDSGRQSRCEQDTSGCSRWGASKDCAPGGCLCPQSTGVAVSQWGTQNDDGVRDVSISESGDLYLTGYKDGGTLFVSAVRPVDFGETWSRAVGVADTWEEGAALISLSQDTIVVVGNVMGQVNEQAPLGGQDLYLASWSATSGTAGGALRWGTSDLDFAYSLASGQNGAFFVTGATSGDLGAQNLGQSDAFLTKVDKDLKLVWSKQWGTAGADGAMKATMNADGSLSVVGIRSGSAFAMRMSSAGDELWSKSWPGAIAGLGVAPLSNGDVVVVGCASGQIAGAQGSGKSFAMRLDASGKTRWARQMSSSDSCARDVAVGTDDSIYVAGDGTGVLVAGATSAVAYDVFVQRLDGDGALGRGVQFGSAAQEDFRAVAVGADDRIFVGGGTWGAFNGFTHLGSRTSDAFVAVVDSLK